MLLALIEEEESSKGMQYLRFLDWQKTIHTS